jgi:hypothetical protein
VLITTFSLKAVTAVLIATAIYGAQFAWPVTCVVFPAITLALRRSNAFTPLLLSAVGAVAGPSLVYLLVKMKMVLLNQTDLDHFMIGGLASGAVLGATFGFAVWRFDHLSRKEIAILP